MSAVIFDACNAVLLLCGSSSSQKSATLKRTVLPFTANELFAQIQQRQEEIAAEGSKDGINKGYSWQIELSCFEIQDEG